MNAQITDREGYAATDRSNHRRVVALCIQVNSSQCLLRSENIEFQIRMVSDLFAVLPPSIFFLRVFYAAQCSRPTLVAFVYDAGKPG